MTLNKIFLKITLIFFIILSFITGFFLRENSAGGGKSDFYEHTWPAIQSFRNDFLFTIKNYSTFAEGSYPLFHIINAYLNPFSNNIFNFQFSITIISFITVFIFSLFLKNIFEKVPFVDIFLTSSIFLLLPFYRTSSFWGLTENLGYLFLIFSLYLFLKIKKNISEEPKNNDILIIFLFCLTSACALYTRQTLVFLPIAFFLYLFFYKINQKKIFLSVFFMALFSIPGFMLIYTWGGLLETSSTDFFKQTLYSPKFIIKNLPIIASYFGFYFLPFVLIEAINNGYKKTISIYLKSFLLILLILFTLSFTNFLDYLSNISLAGGAALKLSYLIKPGNYFLFLIFSALGFAIFMRLISEDKKNNLIFLLPLIIIYCGAKNLFQEYFEPLLLIVFFLVLKTKMHETFFKKIFISNIILILYFSTYLAGAIYFKHFLFYPNTKWHIYLQSN